MIITTFYIRNYNHELLIYLPLFPFNVVEKKLIFSTDTSSEVTFKE